MKEQLENELKEIFNTHKEEIKNLIKQINKLQDSEPPKQEKGLVTDACGCWQDYDAATDCILHRIESFLC